jgi:hypothetical protein
MKKPGEEQKKASHADGVARSLLLFIASQSDDYDISSFGGSCGLN